MRIDVSLVPGEILAKDASRSVVVVIDVLRATSTIVTALASGCEEVIPAECTLLLALCCLAISQLHHGAAYSERRY
jgi:hypothetical protein